MAKKNEEEKLSRWRPYVLPLLVVIFTSLAAVIVFQKVEGFLIHDQRFALTGGALAGEDAPGLRISGLNRAEAGDVRGVFIKDAGRSIYSIPLDARRQELTAIQWVRDASVSRVWPNQVDVRVVERKPEAVVRLPGTFRGSPSSLMLIDSEGVILPRPEDKVRLELPVLAGIRQDQTLEERSARVRMMKRIASELGEMAGKITEYDLRDTVNARLVYDLGDHTVTLLVGHESYASRVRSFVEYYPEVQRKAPAAVTLDLRLPDRITAVEEGVDGK